MEPTSLFRALERTSIEKDISELNDMIQEYRLWGKLSDRNKAYQKILELRGKEPDLNTSAIVMQALSGAVPFEQATDETIVTEMQEQLIYLTDKLRKLSTDSDQSTSSQEAPHANP